jgi:hypothetical protein
MVNLYLNLFVGMWGRIEICSIELLMALLNALTYNPSGETLSAQSNICGQGWSLPEWSPLGDSIKGLSLKY